MFRQSHDSTIIFAEMVELADASDSKSEDGDIVWVQVPLSAPKEEHSIRVFFFFTRDYFGVKITR